MTSQHDSPSHDPPEVFATGDPPRDVGAAEGATAVMAPEECTFEVPIADAVEWPLWRRVGFRFLCVYFVLDVFPFPFGSIPWLGMKLWAGTIWVWKGAALWTGEHVLGIEGEIFQGPSGSGDTTLDYLMFLVRLVLALLLTTGWSLVDRRRRAYPVAARWLVVACRFSLGLVLLNYGLAKVLPTQFSPPGLTSLMQTYGESSPMRLVWVFMGLSPPYTIFAGLMETIPAFLLFFRRTRLLGACLAVAVMSNVVMLNFCFDVPVKLYSSHLLIMAMALVLLDARRLVAFFVRNETAPPTPLPPLFESRKPAIVFTVLATLLVGHAVWQGVSQGLQGYKLWGAGRPVSEIRGIYDVEVFRLDGEELPPLLTDEKRWKALVVDRSLPTKFGEFERPGIITVQHMDDELARHTVELDQEADTITFLPQGQSSVEMAREAGVDLDNVVSYERLESGRMIVRGKFEGQAIEVELKERDLEKLLLISRGFHWINEVPFNR